MTKYLRHPNLRHVLIAAYLLCDYEAVVARLLSLGWSLGLVLFIGLYAVTAASLFIAASIRSTPIRIGFGILFCAGSIFLQGFEWGTRQPLTYSAYLTMLESRDDMGDALYQFGHVFQLVVPIGILLLVAFLIPARDARLPSWVTAMAPIATIGLICSLLFVRGGYGATALPAPFAPIAYAVLHGGSSLGAASTTHVEVPRRARTVDRDIVLIVDESLAPQYLDINHPNGVASGLATPPPGVDVLNYGYAAAILNCSTGANATLRFGGTRDNYSDMKAAGPSIWRYAKRAGLRTVYLDAQRDNGVLQNLMTPKEKAEIDDFVQLTGVPIVDRDVTLATMIAERINDGRPEFIYVNKVGGHFPVHDRYPDSMMRYRPVLPRGHYGHLDDHGQKIGFKGFDGSPASWRLYRNSYRNTLLWSVGEFFKRLLAQADLSRATILYTADHGQDLHERGVPGNGTHCGTQPVQEEGLTPLVIIESKGQQALDWRRNLSENHNKVSGYNIFPTLLTLMHYDPAAIRQHHGYALHEKVVDPFTFNIDYHVLLGREPVWKWIDINKIPPPPLSDYMPDTEILPGL